ncbi:hypothetical protein T10_7816 [Trichinella papuae]|uniref:Uncharacterized protein n=1 Tax=Trichinella papuae TaxID=268474 RepID=A0A0V1MAZ6_9BILA|nr:hypothetical protein T10_7816 [Trichinella papuae]
MTENVPNPHLLGAILWNLCLFEQIDTNLLNHRFLLTVLTSRAIYTIHAAFLSLELEIVVNQQAIKGKDIVYMHGNSSLFQLVMNV